MPRANKKHMPASPSRKKKLGRGKRKLILGSVGSLKFWEKSKIGYRLLRIVFKEGPR